MWCGLVRGERCANLTGDVGKCPFDTVLQEHECSFFFPVEPVLQKIEQEPGLPN